jgi:hypothetical protein
VALSILQPEPKISQAQLQRIIEIRSQLALLEAEVLSALTAGLPVAPGPLRAGSENQAEYSRLVISRVLP